MKMDLVDPDSVLLSVCGVPRGGIDDLDRDADTHKR